MTSRISQFGIKITLLLLRLTVKAVPPDYCLHKLNTSNCQGSPTPVFSYYKPGSRCEIEIWRGCPTYNKFDNEYLCSHYCIYKFIKHTRTTTTMNYDGTEQCSRTVTETCKSGPQTVAYTFNEENQDCLPLIWGECKTPNIFKDRIECLDTCLGDWKNELSNLTETEFEDIDEVLSNFISPNTTAKKLKLVDEINVTSPMTPSMTKETAPVTEVEEPTTKEIITEDTTETEEITTQVVTKEITTDQVTEPVPTDMVTEKATTEIVTEKPTTVKVITEATTDTTTVPRSTRRMRTRGTDYVSEVQLPD